MASAEGTIFKALTDYKATNSNELSLEKNETMILLDCSGELLWRVKKASLEVGLVPKHLIKPVEPGLASKMIRGIKKFKPKLKNQGKEKYYVIFTFSKTKEDEIDLQKGQKVNVLEKATDGWWKGECNGHIGWFPSNFVTNAHTPTGISPPKFLVKAVSEISYTSTAPGKLSYEKGEVFDILDVSDNNWCKVRNKKGKVGKVDKLYLSFKPEGKYNLFITSVNINLC